LPKTKVPPLATDCHHHIYDSHFKLDPNATLRPQDATIADYRLLQKRLGMQRNVVVQPSTYGVDNSGLMSVLQQFGLTTTRGVAVVNTSVTDAELNALNAAGVRGIRFNIVTPGGATSFEMVPSLAKRIHELGWHIQMNVTGAQIVANKALWNEVPCSIVFDHLGHIPQPDGAKHPAFEVVTALMQRGKGWVKLTGLYNDTKVGPPSYADSSTLAAAFVAAAPGQVVWGSDWPHPTEAADKKPDDALLLDFLSTWAPDAALRKHILVDNPAKLYGFA
jgi:predicted TIM-barrel fold metal-dependent hydrolase